MSGRDMLIRGPYLRAPAWAGDIRHPEALLPAGMKLDLTEGVFRRPDAVKVQINNGAGYAVDAVSITVDALVASVGQPNPIIPNGYALHFGGKKLAVVNDAAVNSGDTAIATLPLPTALVDDDVAWYPGRLRRSVPSGTPVGRTIAERDANTPYGPADPDDDEIFLLAFDVEDLDVVNDGVAYRPGHVVYENFLPGWSSLNSDLQDALRELYHMQIAEA